MHWGSLTRCPNGVLSVSPPTAAGLTQVLQDLLQAAAEHGIGLINGLHEPLAKHPTISAICRANHCEIIDLRRPKALAELHFWNGSIRQVKAPRIAVIGTDCALGKRTTARLLTNALNQNHLKTEMIYTGQTGWLQGGRYGFILDSTLNDFVSGELEHAIVRCDREVSPDLILLEGQSALRNPSGPCGAELLVSGEAKGTILQYAPMRRYFEGYESERLAIPSIQSEIELIAHYGSQVLGIAINRENMPDDALRATQQRLEDTLSVPVVCPLTDGVGPTYRAYSRICRDSDPMKITAIRSRLENLALSRPYEIAFRKVEAVQNVFVEIDTDRGVKGYGAASPEPHVTGETSTACEEALETARLDWLIDCDIVTLPQLTRELDRHMQAVPAAQAAVDMALYDLWGRYLQRPLAELLGQCHHALPTSITIGIKSTRDTLEEASEYYGRGFRILKVKLGHSVDEDIERLHVLRQVYSDKMKIRVDANQGYSLDDLQHFYRQTQALDLEFIEQPMSTDNDALLWLLPADMRQQLAADESLLRPRDALRLVNRNDGEALGACGTFVIKLMKCGGVSQAQRIASIADLAV